MGSSVLGAKFVETILQICTAASCFCYANPLFCLGFIGLSCFWQISWFTVLFGKSFSTLLLLTFAGDNQFTDPFAVIIVVVFLISLPAQL
jgi:hypothetical protein